MRVKSHQAQKNTDTWDQEYWSKEYRSNFSRKKDISQLEYIQIDPEELPFVPDAEGEEKERQEQIQKIMSKKMLNLSGMTNADLKLTYGTANFSELSVYDQNYIVFLRNLNLWGCYLYKNKPEDLQRAKQIFEFAIAHGSDITATYLTLADIYRQEGDLAKIQELLQYVQNSDFYLKDSICKGLRECIRSF
jgi:hypothetical protein